MNSVNPFRLEGQKTIMYRVLEGLNLSGDRLSAEHGTRSGFGLGTARGVGRAMGGGIRSFFFRLRVCVSATNASSKCGVPCGRHPHSVLGLSEPS